MTADREQIRREVEGTVPSQWYLDMKQRAERAEAELEQAERALARIGELNPGFAEGGKGAWQVRAEQAEQERDEWERRALGKGWSCKP